MANIFKYTLENFRSKPQPVYMPMNAEVLDCQIQDGRFVIWAMIPNKGAIKADRWFVILYTGEETSVCITNHISTLQMHGLVYHIFEVGSCC